MGVPISTSITMPFMTLADGDESLRQVSPTRARRNTSVHWAYGSLDALDQALPLGRGGRPPLGEDEGAKDRQVRPHRRRQLSGSCAPYAF